MGRLYGLVQSHRKEQVRRIKGRSRRFTSRLSRNWLGTTTCVFTIDLSKYEYVAGKLELNLDDYAIYVYSPSMIAIEKLRAICQQMPEYPLRGYRTARARDFTIFN